MSDLEQVFRLSPRQRRIWELHQAGVATGSSAAVRLGGALDPAALERAVGAVVARHEILRTAIERPRGVKTAVQVVLPAGSARFRRADDGSEAGDRLPAESGGQDRGRPLSAVLRRVAIDEHRLDLSLPALAADGRSLIELVRDIGEAYAAATGGPAVAGEPVQYVQFAEWQNALLEQRGDEGAEHWAARDLSALEELRLPLEEMAPVPGPPERVEVRLDAPEVAALDRLAARGDVGLEPLLLSLWLALLARLSGRAEPAVALVFSGRRFPQLEHALGPFAQAVPVSVDLGGRPSLLGFLPRVESAVREAYDWQDLYEPGERSAIGFELLDLPPPRSFAGVGFEIERLSARGDRLRHKLTALRRGSLIDLVLELSHGTLVRERAEAVLGSLRRLLGAAAERPEAPLDALPILSPDERRRLLETAGGDEAAAAPEGLVHQLVAAQAARRPEAVAVDGDGGRLTYRELQARADRVAAGLRGAGVGPEQVVAVHARRTPGLVAAVLGVLEAGGAFLPLDPDLPPRRLELMARDAGVRVLLTCGDLPAVELPEGVVRLRLEDLEGEPGPVSAPAEAPAPGCLAYVLYTSGSTGSPKGVMVPHQGLANYVAWCCRNYPSGEGIAVPLHSSLAFDLTLTSLFVPLASGGTVLLVAEEDGVEALAAGGAGERTIGFVKLTPSHLDLLRRQLGVEASGRLASLAQAFVFGGEALFGEALEPWRNGGGVRLINEYGPTETVVGCASFELASGSVAEGRVPIGRPISNLRLHVLDRHLEPVPPGVPGELYIGGTGVARGYLGRPGATAAVFVPDPFSAVPGERLYRSGDVAAARADGNLDFLGRADQQLKVRGHRVEPGEIESLLRRHPSVAEAVVTVREDEPGDPRLVAYLVPRGPRPSINQLRSFLGDLLPEALIPNVFVPLESLPLTPSGKVDRRALPAPESGRPDLEERFVAPETPVEKVIAEMWCEVLRVDRVGIDDNFFQLGGHSLLATQVISRVRHRFEVDLPVRSLFDAPTVAAWARLVEEAEAEKAGGLDQVLDEVQDMSEDDVDRLLRELRG